MVYLGEKLTILAGHQCPSRSPLVRLIWDHFCCLFLVFVQDWSIIPAPARSTKRKANKGVVGGYVVATKDVTQCNDNKVAQQCTDSLLIFVVSTYIYEYHPILIYSENVSVSFFFSSRTCPCPHPQIITLPPMETPPLPEFISAEVAGWPQELSSYTTIDLRQHGTSASCCCGR
jgi:hypothetical protein